MSIESRRLRLGSLCFGLAALLALLLAPPAARASTVIVQGTTDIKDAGLLEDVIEPGFAAAYPQYTLQYIAVGTGQAIANAKAGQGDALVTHAPTQEKTFVEEGYSLEPRGRAVFYSDYVIPGPLDDPAGVLAGAPHNAAKAFELIAAAGEAGEANFISRGDNSGTNTQEKAIWKLTGVELNEKGEPGPAGTPNNFSWYHKAGLGQAATVLLTDECPPTVGGKGCYEMTDRGTFNRLVSKGSVTQLKIVSQRNEASAPGGVNLLTNPFSVYIVNPAKIPAVNVEGARAFNDFLSSEQFQSLLANYPSASSPAFFADAHPEIKITSAALPATLSAGAQISVSGTVANLLPGSPPVAGQTVLLQRAAQTGPKEVPSYETLATGSTDGAGAFTIATNASREGRMRILFPTTSSYPALTVTPLIAVGSLAETATDLGSISVASKVGLGKLSVKGRSVSLSGRIGPSEGRSAAAAIVIQGRKAGKKAFQRIKTVHARAGAAYSVRVKLGKGRWKLRVKYTDPGTVQPATSGVRSVSVG
ncbi:MAG TPA: substrate-binding domain-containing protein [Solirubrobacterales bacterium]|nr:substrate-binding domain-containing protein [Solirubrobacterales bacterium]